MNFHTNNMQTFKFSTFFQPHFHDYDYQLLLLETPVPVSPHSRPIAIGRMSDVLPGAMVSVTGWGHSQVKVSSYSSWVSWPSTFDSQKNIKRTNDMVPDPWLFFSQQKAMQNILRQVSVPIIPQQECMLLPHVYYSSITPRMFCAGFHNGTRDSCQVNEDYI